MSNSSVIIFGYGELGAGAVDPLTEAGAEVVGLVVPSNRAGPDVDKVCAFADRRQLPILVQPPRGRVESFITQLRDLDPSVILVWSYSMILPPSVLRVPRAGCVNLHGGLLPEYRGGHVMQWAIINGERETGVTLHYMDEGVDTGPVIAERRFSIEWEDDASTVRQKLKTAGVGLIKNWWPLVANGTAPRVPQDELRARYHRLRTAEDGLINWSASGAQIYNLVRALVSPWPGAFTWWHGRKIVIRRVALAETTMGASPVPGTICSVAGTGIRVATGDGEIIIHEMENAGRDASAGTLKYDSGFSVGEVLGR